MSSAPKSMWQELATSAQLDSLEQQAIRGKWGLALLLIGWLHLLAFSGCDFLSAVHAYHEAAGYLAIWIGELCGVWLIFRFCKRSTPREVPSPLARFVVRVWVSYFLLAFNLGTLNTLGGHELFELFPAMALLASFGFFVMTFTISRLFSVAALVMLIAGLLMSMNLMRSYLTFAIAWWLVLQVIGLVLLSRHPRSLALTPAGIPESTQE
jgi:hypothetical protein